ncbi:MAG: hypothetical protein GY866_29375 [Proteobacteria bacterium]|nr:hypothetical protein [Pseudomonadota bacterium]
MPFQIITIPFDPALELFSEDGLNEFLLNKKLLSWKAEFFNQGNKAYWTVLLEYEPALRKNEAAKFKLNLEQELLYNRLREWRKETAEKQGIPIND